MESLVYELLKLFVPKHLRCRAAKLSLLNFLSLFSKSRRDSVVEGGGVVAEFVSVFSGTRPHSVGGGSNGNLPLSWVQTHIFGYIQQKKGFLAENKNITQISQIP